MNWYKKAQINGGKVKYSPDGNVYILGRNTRLNEGPWRISRLYQGRPAWHDNFSSYESALYAFNMIAGKEAPPDLITEEVYELV